MEIPVSPAPLPQHPRITVVIAALTIVDPAQSGTGHRHIGHRTGHPHEGHRPVTAPSHPPETPQSSPQKGGRDQGHQGIAVIEGQGHVVQEEKGQRPHRVLTHLLEGKRHKSYSFECIQLLFINLLYH